MSANHVGCLIVTDERRLDRHAIGIITDRDLVVQGVANGADPSDTSVGDVMTPQLASIAEHADAHGALEKCCSMTSAAWQ